MFKLVVAAVLVSLTFATSVNAQCGSGGCNVGGGYVISGGGCYSGGCNSGGCVVGSSYVVDPNPLSIRIIDIPGGYEKTRFYVDAYFDDHNYSQKVPVINGYIPTASFYRDGSGRVNHIVYSFTDRIRYDNSFGNSDGYIHYGGNSTSNSGLNAVSSNRSNKPSAVKSYDAPVKASKKSNKPSALKAESFDSDETPATTNNRRGPSGLKAVDTDPFTKVKSGNRRPSVDEEIEGLFNRPSSVKDTNSILNYDR